MKYIGDCGYKILLFYVLKSYSMAEKDRRFRLEDVKLEEKEQRFLDRLTPDDLGLKTNFSLLPVESRLAEARRNRDYNRGY